MNHVVRLEFFYLYIELLLNSTVMLGRAEKNQEKGLFRLYLLHHSDCSAEQENAAT
jgi:hypothetical protein